MNADSKCCYCLAGYIAYPTPEQGICPSSTDGKHRVPYIPADQNFAKRLLDAEFDYNFCKPAAGSAVALEARRRAGIILAQDDKGDRCGRYITACYEYDNYVFPVSWLREYVYKSHETYKKFRECQNADELSALLRELGVPER